MKIKDSLSRKIFVFCNNLFMLFVFFVTLYPMLYVLFASFSSPSQLMAHEGFLLKPLGFTTAAYEAVLKNPFIWSGYRNSIFVCVTAVLIGLFGTAVAAYFFSRKNVMHARLFMILIVITMHFGGGLIPTYLMYRALGFENSLWVLILPGCVAAGNVIILRTTFQAIPDSLEEAATIDGAGNFTILFRILLPLVIPTMAVLGMYSVVSHWNAWFGASIYIRDREKFPLQLILREILIQNDTSLMQRAQGVGQTESVDPGEGAMLSLTLQYATIMVATIPILCIYPFLQKHFVKGTMVGAVKG